MERLTGRAQNTYPVERTIMEAEAKPQSRERRIADLVRRHTERKDKPNPENENARPQAGGRQGSLAEKYKHNKELQKLAEELDDAITGRRASTTGYLEKLFELVGRGKVSENQAYQFTQDVNPRISERNFSDINNGDRELAQDVEAIVAQRKAKGLTAEEAQASRAAMEAAFGRRLTEAEFRRAVYGEKIPGTSESARSFEAQIGLIEQVAGDERRFDSFIKSLEKLDGETIKRVLNDKGGEVVFGILLGDVAENREVFFEKFRKELGGHPNDIRAALSVLAREVEKQEQKENPKVDPERQRLAREAAEQWIKEQKRRRQVTAEEIDTIFSNAERGIPLIAGGAGNYEHGLGFLELIDDVPNEPGDAFERAKSNLTDGEIPTLLAQDMYEDEGMVRVEQERFQNLRNIDNPAEFKSSLRRLTQDLLRRYQASMNNPEREKERQETEAAVRELASTNKGRSRRGIEFDTSGIEGIVNTEREPRNIIEVAAWIMASDDKSVWGPDGVYPIFEYTGELDPNTNRPKAKFKPENLIRWLRNKSLEHHGDNPNDPLNLLQGISIETIFRSISILQMKYQKQKYFADENGRPLSDLAEEVINEAWLFGVRRNKNLGYIQAMNSDEKLFEAIVEMSGKNDHTGGQNLANHLRMGEEYSHEGEGLDNKVGDAMLAANHIYRNLSDIEKLRQMIPTNSPLFTLEGFKNASRILNNQGFDESTAGFGNLKIEGNRVYFLDPRTKIRTEIFKPDGSLVSDKNLVKFLNFFPEATPQETNETFVRELVKQSIADIVGFDSGVDKGEYEEFKRKRKEAWEKRNKDIPLGERSAYKEVDFKEYRKIVRMNLEWAETNSWVEQRWNGAAARNDTGYRGYDAWTKMYAQYYRERQSGARTAGPIGNPHDMQIFRLLTPDMWLAIRTESGESVHEVFEDIHMLNMQIYSLKGELTEEQKKEKEKLLAEKKKAYEKLRFPRWTESDWASNGVNRQAQVWHNIMNTEDLGFNELVKKDNWGVLRYDRQKFEEVVKDDFIKKRRYAFSSNNAMNYGAVTRMRIPTGWDDKGNRVFEYKDMYMAEAMFGDVVIDSIRQDFFDGKLEYETADENGIGVKKRGAKKGEDFDPKKHGTFQEYLNSAQARERLLKNICRAGIAAQINAHREHGGTTERWNSEMVRKIYQSLRSMPEYMEDPITGKERKLDESQFFSKEDIKWIRKQTGTTKGKLLWEDSYHAGWDIFAGAFPDIIKMFYDDIVS